MDTTSVATMLRLRLKEMMKQKEEHLKEIKEAEEELKKLFAKAPKKIRGSAKDMDDEIAALEFKRTTSSLVLVEEKEILRQIASLQRNKTLCRERKAHEDVIQNKKAQLKELRDSISLILASIDELTPVLHKVELAEKLSCTAAELKTITVEFPKSKTGHLIGKNGATIKQIMTQTQTAIEVDADKCQMEITGSDSAVELAKEEIRKIAHTIEMDVHVSATLVEYITSRRLTAFADFREQHPDVYVDVVRNSTTIHLEGLPEDVSAAKDALLSFDVKQECRSLTSIEAGVVVGKKGININKIIDEHKVTIDVSKSGEEYSVSVAGPASNVDVAMESIDDLLDLNKDVTERVHIDPIVKNVLLNNGGALIKQLQKDVNAKTKDNGGSVFLSIDKDATLEDSSLHVKARRTALVIALEMMDEAIKDIMASVVTIQVDPYIVPRIIGKGGAHIKEMKKQGNGVTIEVDKSGKTQLYGSDNADVEAVVHTIQRIVEENQVEKLGFDTSSINLTYRALVRAKSKEINSIVSGMDLDEETSQIVLRGTAENIKIVKDMIEEFMPNNYIEEIKFEPENELALLMGGADSVVNKMTKEFDVDLNVSRSNHVIAARGKKENVLAAKKRLNQFLHGGDGHSVSKIIVSEQAVGTVIGKGGSRRVELEEKHDGVKIAIEPSSGIITLRGPDAVVHSCRVEIIKIVSSVRVQEFMPITSEQHAELSKPDAVRRVTSGIPVQVTVADDAIKVRGIFSDVRDALALLKAHLTGVYEARLELDPAQYSKVSGTARDPSHFNRMKECSNAEIDLDPSRNSIVIHGKRANVKKAKILVMGLLDFILPSNFEHIKVSKVFHSSVANASSLADIAAMSGASVALDRDLNSVSVETKPSLLTRAPGALAYVLFFVGTKIHVQSSDPDKVKEAVKLIKSKITEAEKLVFVFHIDQNESWLIPVIIGKGGQQISALSAESNCRIDVSRQELSITITGEDEESVSKARKVLDAAIDKAKRECVFVQLPSNSVPAFIGKAGAHVQQFAKDHNVVAERVRKEPSKIKITGHEDSVSAAKEALLEWIGVWEENNAEVSIPVDKTTIPFVLGKDGSVINALQKDSGCRIDIDRNSSIITIRAGTAQKRAEVIEKINGIVAEVQEAIESEREQKRERDAEERAEKAKVEKILPAVTEPVEDASPDSRKDRTVEFAARPVGLSEGASEANQGRNRNKSKPISTPVGTAAGRNLFGLLVSDEALNTNESESLSTSDISSNGNAAEEGPIYYKSVSGFTVRV